MNKVKKQIPFINKVWNFLKNKLFLSFIIICLVVFLFSQYKFTTYIKQDNIKILNISGEKVFYYPNKYNQWKYSKDKLFYNFINSFSNQIVTVNQDKYVLHRPLPETIISNDQKYYFNKDKNQLNIAKNIEDFTYLDSVFIVNPNTGDYNFTSNSPKSWYSSIFENKLYEKINCNNHQNSKCQNKIDSFEFETSFIDKKVIEFKLTANINPNQNPKDIRLGFNMAIPDDLMLCNSQKCFESETVSSSIKDIPDMPVKLFENRVFTQEKKLADLNLDRINLNKLSLANLDTEIPKNQNEKIEKDIYFLRDEKYSKKVEFVIDYNKDKAEDITIDYLYDNYLINFQPCESQKCQQTIRYKVNF